MSKIWLVIQREYRARIRKPSFWILALLVPLLLAAAYALPIVLASRPAEHADVLVVDETGLFEGRFRSGRDVTYHDAGSLEYAQRQLAEVDTLDAVVFIPAREVSIPLDAFLYYRSSAPAAAVQANVDRQLQEILRNAILMDVHGINPDDYAMLTGTRMKLRLLDLETGRDGYLRVKAVAGFLLALLVFVAVFLFGSQVMRGVVEEKSSRIVEVVICSVKPFQLMMGKVVGIGLAGLTQFALWAVLAGAAVGGLRTANADLFAQAARPQVTQLATKGAEATAQYEAAAAEARAYEQGIGLDKSVRELLDGLSSINFGLLAVCFLFYFLTGYLLYAGLFAAVGAAVDPDTDSQQFTLPVTLPLLVAVLLLPAVMQSPSGSLGVWLSLIPFTSPVAMLFRIPFGVPVWQLLLSAVLLLGAFVLCIWLAARAYRAGILRTGRK